MTQPNYTAAHMTIREHFAIEILKATYIRGFLGQDEPLAENAVKQADALIAALNKADV